MPVHKKAPIKGLIYKLISILTGGSSANFVSVLIAQDEYLACIHAIILDALCKLAQDSSDFIINTCIFKCCVACFDADSDIFHFDAPLG